MSRFIPLALSLALLQVPSAIAQNKPAEAPVAPQDDIVVNGSRETPKEQIERAVRALAPERKGRQLSRWNDRVCVKVIGLWPERDRAILDHIGAVAKKVGVNYQEAPKCTANTVILFTTGADKFAALAMEKFPGLLKDVESFGLPQRQDKAPYLVPRPVRWLPVNQTGLNDGGINSPVGESRITSPTRENTVGTLIIVDETKLAGVKWSQLAEYLAMVTFAQPALDADFSTIDTVMAMFSARDAGRAIPAGLTRQDEVFLTALYRLPGDLSAPQQRDEIERSIGKALNNS